jgi:hypothetical protein
MNDFDYSFPISPSAPQIVPIDDSDMIPKQQRPFFERNGCSSLRYSD